MYYTFNSEDVNINNTYKIKNKTTEINALAALANSGASSTTIQASDIPFITLLQNKPPWGIYSPTNWINGVWYEARNNGRNAITVGVGKSTSLGNGAASPITCLYGSTTSTIAWPAGSIASTFTLFTMGRYSGATKQRIFATSTGSNWVHGHVTGPVIGVVYYDKLLSSSNTSIPLTNWVVQGAKNSGPIPYNIMTNGVAKGIDTGGSGNQTLVVNIRGPYQEFSDFEASEVSGSLGIFLLGLIKAKSVTFKPRSIPDNTANWLIKLATCASLLMLLTRIFCA
jgi:hypothetical protein